MTTPKQKIINIISYASGLAANNADCWRGPLTMQESKLLDEINVPLQWKMTVKDLTPAAHLNALPIIIELTNKIAAETFLLTKTGSRAFVRDDIPQKFILLGGDHSSAIGTWSGVADAIRPAQLGLIWIDAHMDSHTPETSESGNLHGMPLACLLGYGPKQLTELRFSKAKLLPQNICLIGVRSYEKGEAELLRKLNVRIFFMKEIQEKGIAQVLQEAIQIVSKNTQAYGLSIDLDAIDPVDAPGVGTPAANGINGKNFCAAVEIFNNDARLAGVEIVEFNPLLDKQEKTAKIIRDIIKNIYARKSNG